MADNSTSRSQLPEQSSVTGTAKTRPRFGGQRGSVNTAVREVARRIGNWAAFNHYGTAPARWIRYTLVGLAIAVISIVFGITTAKTTANFGPHTAQYAVTIDSAISVDAGPLGSVILDSPLPLSLGVHATVGEIPASLTSVEESTTLQALTKDLDGYLQFFGAPNETISLVATLLVSNAVTRAVAMAVGLLVLAALFAFVAGRSRRIELSYRAARNTAGITAGFLVMALIAGFAFTKAAQYESQALGGIEAPVFAGTALEGAKITGRLAGVVDEYGGQLMDIYNQNEAFYAGANRELERAFDIRNAFEAHSTELQEKYSAVPPSARDLVTILMVTDLHCNVGVAPLITTAAEKSGATIVMNAGDTTINGTNVERFCVDAFAKAVPNGAVMVQADGNHDSDETSAQARNAGVIVLDGEIIDVQGVKFLGDSDPRRTQFGQGSSYVGTERYADAGARLSDVACASENSADVLLIHTPAVGNYALPGGCLPYQFSGHLHSQSGPTLVGLGVQYIGGSSAGAIEGKATIGPLSGNAEMTVFRFDRNTRTFIDRQVVTVTAAGTAQVGPRLAYPTAQDLIALSPAPSEGEDAGLIDPETGLVDSEDTEQADPSK